MSTLGWQDGVAAVLALAALLWLGLRGRGRARHPGTSREPGACSGCGGSCSPAQDRAPGGTGTCMTVIKDHQEAV